MGFAAFVSSVLLSKSFFYQIGSITFSLQISVVFVFSCSSLTTVCNVSCKCSGGALGTDLQELAVKLCTCRVVVQALHCTGCHGIGYLCGLLKGCISWN